LGFGLFFGFLVVGLGQAVPKLANPSPKFAGNAADAADAKEH
jgi:hypothetical protein